MHHSRDDLHEIWHTARALLDERMTGPAQRAWLDRTAPIGLDGSTLVLAAPDSFAREQLDSRYGRQLREAISTAAGRALSVVVTVVTDSSHALDADQPAVAPTEAVPSAPQPAETRDTGPSGNGFSAVGNGTRSARSHSAPEDFPTEVPELAASLNPGHTFDRFVIGANNRFAHAAAFAVAEAPAKAFNPLFIYGGAGLGKTHLIQAVAHYSARLFPHLNGRYVTSEQFTNEFIDAISNKRSVPFQRRYRDVDLLLIDDVQFLARKPQTQEEFFHTFNVLHNAGKQIVITSDRPPKQIGHLEERLRTRFEQGLICDVQPPELETRLAILRRKSAHEGYQVPDEVLELIADRISSNIRELEGALIRVTAFASIHGVEVTPKLAGIVLQDLYPDDGHAEVNVSLIMSETASYFGFTVDDLVGPRRTRPLANARQIAMYLTREMTDLSLPKIGQAFGDRDHSTVQHANKKISELIGTRPDLLAQVQELTSRIKVARRR